MALIRRFFRKGVPDDKRSNILQLKNSDSKKNYLKHINKAEIMIKKRRILAEKNIYSENNEHSAETTDKRREDASYNNENKNCTKGKGLYIKNDLNTCFLENNFEKNSNLCIESPEKKVMVHTFIEDVAESPKRYRCSKKIEFNFQ